MVLMVVLCWALLKALKEDADQAPELQADYVREPRVAAGATEEPGAHN